MASVYVPPATSSGDSCSGSCGTSYDQQYQYLSAYFPAHMLSYSSHRYAYLMWFVIAGCILIFSALYHLGIGDKTWVGAYWTKFAPKSRIVKFGKKAPPNATLSRSFSQSTEKKGRLPVPQDDPHAQHSYPPKSPSQLASAPRRTNSIPAPRRHIYTFPSFGRMILVSIMLAVPLILSLVGADYIRPSASMFDMSASWPSADDARYGYYGKRSTSHFAHLAKRLQWGIGSFSPISTTAASYSIPYHTWWTVGGRFGLMSNALTPFIVILALKQVPWAIISLRIFGSYGFERLSFLHKWGGRLLVAFAVVHTVTWSVQLYRDQQFGGSLWSFVFIWNRFRWAFVAIGFLILLAVLSIGPIRTNYYEFFWISHIICAIGFMVATALHHPPLAGWMWASLTWWAAERATRIVKVAWINGIGFAGRKPQQVFASSGAPNTQDRYRRPSMTPFQPGYRANPSFGAASQSQIQQYYEKGTGGSVTSHGGTLTGSRRHTNGTSVSSATLHDHNGYSQGLKAHPGHADYGVSPMKPAFLDQDPLSQPSDPDEWDLDENGDKVRRRPSQRYGPVSDLLKEYTSGTRKTMSGIDEDSVPTTPSRSATPTDNHDYPLADQDIAFYPRAGGHEGVSLSDAPAQASYDGHPGSSADHYTLQNSPRSAPQALPVSQNGRPRDRSPSNAPANDPRPALPADVAALIKPGYAFAQILPGKTLRLTLRTPNRMSWYPGQWVYLNVPSVRGWQSHPFTIASAYDAAMPIVSTYGDQDVEKGLRKERRKKGEERTMVLLLRARQGFTLQLWDYVRRHRHRQVMAAAEAGEFGGGDLQSGSGSRTTTGVHLRAIVDGAYGSTQRVRWGIHSSIVIVCGGSGVSFGISLLEHLCNCMVQRNLYGKSNRGGKSFEVQRVRFVWILREFAHLQWVSSALRRCIEMVPPEQLRVDLYVTHFNNQMSLGGPHRPSTPGGMTRQSSYDMLYQGSRPNTSEGWQTGSGGWQDAQGNVKAPQGDGGTHHLMEGPEADDLEIGANDLTEFDGEDMAAPTSAEQEINSRIQREGKVRRAHTRKVTMRRKEGRRKDGAANAPPPMVKADSQAVLAQRAIHQGQIHSSIPDSNSYRQGTTDGPAWRYQRRRSSGAGLRVPNSAGSAFITPESSQPGSPGLEPSRLPSENGMPASPFMGPAHRGEWRHSGSHLGGYGSSLGGHSTMDDLDSVHQHKRQHTLGANSMGHQSNVRLLPQDAAAVAAAADEILDFADYPIDLDEEEDLDLRIIAELAHPGHPRLDRIVAEEVAASRGRVMVTGCGPANLSALLRRIVAKHIDPAKARRGDKSGQINLCIESFEWGGS